MDFPPPQLQGNKWFPDVATEPVQSVEHVLCLIHHRAAQAPYCKRPPPKPPATLQPPEARSLVAMIFGGNWCLREAAHGVGAEMSGIGSGYILVVMRHTQPPYIVHFITCIQRVREIYDCSVAL